MHHYSRITPSAPHQAAVVPEFASILVVDDQRFDRTRLGRLCNAFGFTTHVVEADSLAAMRDKLKKDRFDLILLDYHLPDGTGLDGVDAIRADGVNKDAAIVMITGTEQTDIAVKALKLGFSDYLTKDELSQETLTRAAITALQKSRLVSGFASKGTQHNFVHDTLQSFSRECAHDIKPIVTRMMRQMRELREIDTLPPQEARQRVERVEGSLRRLWAFLDDLDRLSASQTDDGPTVPSRRADPSVRRSGINIRVPSERPARPIAKKPPSIFRRRPD
ncbi:response regulator [Sulfitobacter sp. F26169L]|uniref:response regulator n=1 Tax=Sulfitobacter sp. F26169L TaxID=2996015 RepID=UPI002260CDB9|nr:hybrid sensor histidine kinase/response regulator [Sulfitobacter sp. F26169L]MCX7567082.1 response regulator [Sulfitobacter sp. F26169L]